MNGDNYQVLVVDDDELTRLEIIRSVEKAGYAVSQAENGARALDMLREKSFALVLLDLLMPDVDGFEVLRQMKADPALKEIPVIVITAIGSEAGLPPPSAHTTVRTGPYTAVQEDRCQVRS